MSSVRKESALSKNDSVEKILILEAFWEKCIKEYNQEGVDYLKSQLKKYMKARPSSSHLQIEQNINQINASMTCEAFKHALNWITPLEAKLIDLFENLKIVEQIERRESKEFPVKLNAVDLEMVSEYLKEMKISVSMAIGNIHDKTSHLLYSPGMPSAASFAIHSVTKIFTGMLALKMVEKGIISEEMLKQPIKNLINEKAWELLPGQVRTHLQDNAITLYQLMIHHGGLGDYYHNEGGYRKALEQKDSVAPRVDQVKDFLQFAEDKIYPPGEEHYSNLGITLVGLAIEEAYRRVDLEANLDFDGILYEYLIKPAKLDRADFSKNIPSTGRFNENDPIAQHWVGGPAGGYWATPETLDQFGRWLYKECATNPDFMLLAKKYGQEFYKEDRNVIEHSGTFNSASAFFYLSLTTGNMLNILSDQQLIAPILMSTIRRSMFRGGAETLTQVEKAKTNSKSSTLVSLKELAQQDQAARKPPNRPNQMEDKARRNRANEVITELESEHKATVEDYYYAAMIFNHGNGEDDLSKAHNYATKSKNMGYFAGITYSGNTWLFAATYDRLQLESSVPKPQKFGTQYSAEDNDRMGYIKDDLRPHEKGYFFDKEKINKDRKNIGLGTLEDQEKDWGIIRPKEEEASSATMRLDVSPSASTSASTQTDEKANNTWSTSNALTPEFKQSIVEHAIASGRNANCFFQSFFHTLTAQSPETLNAIKIKYKDSIAAFVDTFNSQLSLKPSVDFDRIIDISKKLHPLERECLFGPILRHTYDTMIDRNILSGSKLKHGPDDIMYAFQTRVFCNAFGAEYHVYMNEEQFNLVKKGGMPAETAERVVATQFEINGRAFYHDFPPEQALKNGKMFELNIVYADRHLNYTLGDSESNNKYTKLIIPKEISKFGGVYAERATDEVAAPLAKEGLEFTAIANGLCERFQLTRSEKTFTTTAHTVIALGVSSLRLKIEEKGTLPESSKLKEESFSPLASSSAIEINNDKGGKQVFVSRKRGG